MKLNYYALLKELEENGCKTFAQYALLKKWQKMKRKEEEEWEEAKSERRAEQMSHFEKVGRGYDIHDDVRRND